MHTYPLLLDAESPKRIVGMVTMIAAPSEVSKDLNSPTELAEEQGYCGSAAGRSCSYAAGQPHVVYFHVHCYTLLYTSNLQKPDHYPPHELSDHDELAKATVSPRFCAVR